MASREEYAKRMHEKMNATYYEWLTNTPVEIADNLIDIVAEELAELEKKMEAKINGKTEG